MVITGLTEGFLESLRRVMKISYSPRVSTNAESGIPIMRKSTLLCLVLLLATGCGKKNNDNAVTNNASTNGEANNGDTNNATTNNAETNNVDLDMGTEDVGPLAEDRSCDSLNDGHCMMPFPSNAFLVPDDERATGYQLTFGSATLPVNRVGAHIDPTPYGRLDGYGPGAPAIALFPNVDANGFPTEYSVADSMAEDASILLYEIAADGSATRVPYWVDHDAQTDDDALRSLIVRPAVILKEETRYAVAFRDLQDTTGAAIEPSEAFQRVLSGDTADDPNLFYRQERFDELFDILEAEGVARGELVLAWDWVTGSGADGMHRFMLHLRDEAFQTVGEMGPELTVTEVTEFDPAEDENTAVRIKGTFEAPNYIVRDGPVKRLRIGADGLPEAMGTRTAEFWINVPHSAIDGDPHGLMMYGHGLFGSGSRAWADFNSRIANNHDLIVYGASLWGMSSTQEEEDAFQVVGDLTNFPSLGDQLHQGMMEWLILTRAMKNRLPGLTELTARDVTVNADETFYSGISQGGIFGPTFVALSPEITYGHAGVPGINYAVLLHRSVDFEEFFSVLRGSYPDPLEQLMGLHTIQLLWDQTDSVSYVRHLEADPFDAGDTNHVLFAPAKGDFQVSVVQNEVLARTDGLGIALMENYDAERTVDLVTPQSYPHQGSAVVLYDFNQEDLSGMTWRNLWPPAGNRTPTGSDDDMCAAECPAGESIERARFDCCYGTCCYDAHELPRRRDWHNEQMVHFFRNAGEVIDVCGGDGCTPD